MEKSQSPTLVWSHSCLKMNTQLPYSTMSWIWPRKLWNIWIQISLLCSRWTSHWFEPDILSVQNSDKHRWRLNNCSLNTGLLLLISSSVSSGLCVGFIVATTIREMNMFNMPWRFASDHVNYEMSNFQLTQFLLPWSICCVETKIEEKAWRPLWTTYPKLRNLAMNRFTVFANKCAEEDANVSRQLAIQSPLCMPWELSPWQGRVSWLQRGCSTNEVIVFNTAYN